MERIPRLAANGSWLDDILGFAKGKKDQRKGTNAGLPEVRGGRAKTVLRLLTVLSFVSLEGLSRIYNKVHIDTRHVTPLRNWETFPSWEIRILPGTSVHAPF